MCGLVGVAGNLAYKDETFMKRLLLLDYFRGTDSTGLAAITTKNDISVVKMATHPINLMDSTAFKTALNGFASSVFIGHNRAATLGKVNDLNAHPFQFGDIVGAHNGTLIKSSWDDLMLEAGVRTDVDSAAIFASINEVGIDATIALMEEGKTSQTGAWALVWYDTKDNTLRFLRNEHRPLWWCLNKEGDRLAWASEWPMLEAACHLTNGWEEMEDDEGYAYFPFDVNTLYEIPVEKLTKGLKIQDILDCRTRELKGKEPAPVTPVSVGAAPFQMGGSHTPHSRITPSTQARGTTNGGTGSNGDEPRVLRLPIVDREGDPFAGTISLEEARYIVKDGCSFCGGPIDLKDPTVVVFADEGVALCNSCTGSKNIYPKVYVSPEKLKELNTEKKEANNA